MIPDTVTHCLCEDPFSEGGSCMQYDSGYPWCRPCAEHHRPPECDVNPAGESLAWCGCRWSDVDRWRDTHADHCPDEARKRVLAEADICAAASRGKGPDFRVRFHYGGVPPMHHGQSGPVDPRLFLRDPQQPPQ